MSQFTQELADLAILLFVISSMFGMGLKEGSNIPDPEMLMTERELEN